MVREREVSPLEVVQECLDRAGRWQHLNAFTGRYAEDIVEQARQQTLLLARGGPRGPLFGVPVAVKDLFDVAGWETSGCSNAYRGNVATEDAEVVRRLREAGAIIFGKTNQHELAAGATNLVSSHGPTRNPWDPARITGGSSGGSAAAVAARVVPAALGTDTGGSIRIPASFCGVVGLKPTFGRVSMRGAMVLAELFDTAGPLATTVADASLVFAVLTGEGRNLLEEVGRPITGLRVSAAAGPYVGRLHPEMVGATDTVLRVLESEGAWTGVADLGPIGDAAEVWDVLAWPQFASVHGSLLQRPQTLYPLTRRLLQAGADRTAVEYLRASMRLEPIRNAFLRALSEADVLVVPTTPFAAPPADVDQIEMGGGERLDVNRGGPSRLTRPINLAGLPALSLPAGFTTGGLPVGVQLIGRPGEEALLLRCGRVFQKATDFHRRAPSPDPHP